MADIINLCEHDIVLVLTNGDHHTFKGCSKENVARVASTTHSVMCIDDVVEVGCVVFGEPVNVPAPCEGTFFIVSLMLRAAMPQRKDLLSPDTGATAIRVNGQVQAVRRFICNL